MYYFENVEGKLSDPFTPLSTADQGDTDDTRPSFAQNGNTYIAQFATSNRPRRTISAPSTSSNIMAWPRRSTKLRSPASSIISRFDPFHLQLLGEFVDNLAFSQNAIDQVAVNNRGGGGTGTFAGGDKGYNVKLNVGQPVLEKLWDWNLDLTYRYVESDATVDGFTDADFGGPLVGTNLKGYIIGGNLALSPRVSLALHYMSADAIAGPPYHNDLFQFDINAKF